MNQFFTTHNYSCKFVYYMSSTTEGKWEISGVRSVCVGWSVSAESCVQGPNKLPDYSMIRQVHYTVVALRINL